MKNLYNCKICSSNQNNLTITAREMMFGTGVCYEYFRCDDCGALQIVNPEMDTEKTYPQNYYSIADKNGDNYYKERLRRFVFKCIVAYEIGQFNLIGKIFSRIRPSKEAQSLRGIIKKNHRILDIGCGTGYLIKALSELGFENLIGVEPNISKDIVEKKYKVLKGKIDDIQALGKFDVVMLHHSFEHMHDPDNVMENIEKLLAPEGICILRIPVNDCDAFEEYRENWSQLDAPRHIFLHSEKSINLLAKRNGMKIQRIVDDSGIFQFVVSEQYRSGIPLNSKNSFYRPFIRKIFYRDFIERSKLNELYQKANLASLQKRGDQKSFYLIKTVAC